MYNIYTKNDTVKHYYCYNARTIFEANMCIVWGSISPKLAENLSNYIAYLPERRYVLHIEGCHQQKSTHEINFDRVIKKCLLSKNDLDQTIMEARQCLIA